VRKIYLPASSQAEEKIRLAGRHLDNDSRGMTGELAAVIKRSRTLFRFGALFSFLLFVIFVRDIRRSTVLPAARAAPVPRPVDENRPIGTGL
jgi:hypothetical protein